MTNARQFIFFCSSLLWLWKRVPSSAIASALYHVRDSFVSFFVSRRLAGQPEEKLTKGKFPTRPSIEPRNFKCNENARKRFHEFPRTRIKMPSSLLPSARFHRANRDTQTLREREREYHGGFAACYNVGREAVTAVANFLRNFQYFPGDFARRLLHLRGGSVDPFLEICSYSSCSLLCASTCNYTAIVITGYFQPHTCAFFFFFMINEPRFFLVFPFFNLLVQRWSERFVAAMFLRIPCFSSAEFIHVSRYRATVSCRGFQLIFTFEFARLRRVLIYFQFATLSLERTIFIASRFLWLFCLIRYF